MPNDLLSLVLILRPLGGEPATGKLPPTWWGRAAHALLLNVVRQADPARAEALHADNQPRPFTVSSLLGRFAGGRPDPAQAYRLRFTALEAGLAELLLQAARSGPLAVGEKVELDDLQFRVEGVAGNQQSAIGNPQSALSNPHSAVGNQPSEISHLKSAMVSPWAGATSYPELSAPWLLAKTPAPRQVALQFTSPAAFKSGGKHVPVPLPELVFGSLLERWNAFAPIAFPPEAKRYAAECLAISRYRLSTRVVPLKAGGLRVGAVGQATYTALNYDRYWMSVIGVLAAFALFSGVGAGTGLGLGQCRPAAPQSQAPGPEG